MKVAILTMFNGLSTYYSLVNVVGEHIKALLDANIEVSILVSEDCPDSDRHGIFLDKRLEWIKVTNRYKGERIHWRNYSNPNIRVHDELLDEAETVGKDLVEKLKDKDVCMMHDILYQGMHLLHNLAIRYAQSRLPNLRFIAMTHSLPDTSQVGKDIKWPHSARYSPMKNTIFAYPTKCGLEALSKQYNVDIGKCRVINNSINLLENMSKEVNEIHYRIDLLSPDILIVYPARATRAKQFEKVSMLAGYIKKVTFKSIKIVFCDSPAVEFDRETYKEFIIKIGLENGLDQRDMIFTSDLGYYYGVKREVVLELFTLSNLFICPSFTESFSLTTLEAASRGNLLVINDAVPALNELGKVLDVYRMKWSARKFFETTKERYIPSEDEYFKYHAQNIVDSIYKNPVLKAKTLVRQRYSPKYIYENQIRPILFQNI